MTTPTPLLIGLPITNAGRPVATVQYGTAGSHPLHAAACRVCGTAVYDLPVFDDAALWIRDHLRHAHGVDVVVVDARPLVRKRPGPWARRVAEAVAQLTACWGDTAGAPLVAISWTHHRAA